jgi:tetratricopeptide (TPR) repeat protein
MSERCRWCKAESAHAERCPTQLVGTTFGGRYRIDGVIGLGGMGAVFAATELGTDREVALKLLLPSSALSPEMYRHFKDEAAQLARLAHPSIVRLYDFGETSDGHRYMAMERLHGQTLFELYLRGRQAPELEAVVEIAAQVLQALAAAHAADIVHSDVKPQNIFVVEGPELSVKLLDFGVARPPPERADSQSPTLYARQLVGTPEYCPPARIREPGNVSPRWDLYGLAATIYHLLTGRFPVRGKSGEEVCRKVLDGRVRRSPRRVAGWVPIWLDEWVVRAMSTDPATSFASAAQMLAALGPERQKLAELTAHRQRAQALASAGRHALAVDQARAALDLTRELFGGPHPEVARALCRLVRCSQAAHATGQVTQKLDSITQGKAAPRPELHHVREAIAQLHASETHAAGPGPELYAEVAELASAAGDLSSALRAWQRVCQLSSGAQAEHARTKIFAHETVLKMRADVEIPGWRELRTKLAHGSVELDDLERMEPHAHVLPQEDLLRYAEAWHERSRLQKPSSGKRLVALQRSLGALESALGRRHPQLVPVLADLAWALRYYGRNPDEVSSLWRRVLSIAEATEGPNSDAVANAAYHAALASIAPGGAGLPTGLVRDDDALIAADELLERAQQIWKQIPERAERNAETRALRARIALIQRRVVDADELVSRALAALPSEPAPSSEALHAVRGAVQEVAMVLEATGMIEASKRLLARAQRLPG